MMMAKKSGVTWCDSAVNPTIGCVGCEIWNPKAGVYKCYAGKMYRRFHPHAIPFESGVKERPGRMAECRKWPDLTGKRRPLKPWLDLLPRIVFISDMSDAILAPFEYLYKEIIPVVRETPHLYLWPTKHPGRMVLFAQWLEDQGEWPENLVPGVSITSEANRQRLSVMASYPGWKKRPFISYEPALEYVDLTNAIGAFSYFSLVIFGGISGAGSTAVDVRIARRVMEETRAAKFFMKQLGGRGKSDLEQDFPVDLRVREYPEEWYKQDGGEEDAPHPTLSPRERGIDS
jgi:protein gp37